MLESFISSDTVGAVVRAMTPVADALGKAGAWTFEQALRMNFAYAAVDLVWILCAIVGATIFFKKAFPWMRDQAAKATSYDEGGWQVCMGLSTIAVCAVVFCVVLGYAPDMLYRLISPQWMTIKDLVALAGQLPRP